MGLEQVREVTGEHPCDKRRPMREVRQDFPNVDFSSVSSEEDDMYLEDRRETDEEASVRCEAFLTWLGGREEVEVVVVTHSAFLRVLLQKTTLCVPSARALWYKNCEMRTFSLEAPHNEDEGKEEENKN